MILFNRYVLEARLATKPGDLLWSLNSDGYTSYQWFAIGHTVENDGFSTGIDLYAGPLFIVLRWIRRKHG